MVFASLICSVRLSLYLNALTIVLIHFPAVENFICSPRLKSHIDILGYPCTFFLTVFASLIWRLSFHLIVSSITGFYFLAVFASLICSLRLSSHLKVFSSPCFASCDIFLMFTPSLPSNKR